MINTTRRRASVGATAPVQMSNASAADGGGRDSGTPNVSAPENWRPKEIGVEGGDSEILTALREVRSRRAWVYSFDDTEARTPPEPEYLAADAVMQQFEDIIYQTTASTIAGVRARLELALVSISQNREVDRLWAEHGAAALYEQRRSLVLDHYEQQIVQAIHELAALQAAKAPPSIIRSRPDVAFTPEGAFEALLIHEKEA